MFIMLLSVSYVLTPAAGGIAGTAVGELVEVGSIEEADLSNPDKEVRFVEPICY